MAHAQLQRDLEALGCPTEILASSPLQVHGSKRELLHWLHARARAYLHQALGPTSGSEADMLLARWLLQTGIESQDVCARLIDGTLGVDRTNGYLRQVVDQLLGFEAIATHGADACVAKANTLLNVVCANEALFLETKMTGLFPPSFHAYLAQPAPSVADEHRRVAAELDAAMRECDRLRQQYPTFDKGTIVQAPPTLGALVSALELQLQTFALKYRQEVQVWLRSPLASTSEDQTIASGIGSLVTSRTKPALDRCVAFVEQLQSVLARAEMANQRASTSDLDSNDFSDHVAALLEEMNVLEAALAGS
ncbi:hypothetical protein SPRG_05490 [Saprolegnia parasitica CBS 223.65]|uniref:Uncharacterized protein n=1 Tax=Saprolegnia parasitica (strain CBS 223.65) TaxID=695850 RepID=A0A067CFK1_SAPPC|nr:hypothetical protein SPRG_05490 [Saprolegnia parasitica CBS 223.65]KDO29534.1 hypothetical protein SPRG_05490 [Saprolegnia parasitica CBS 223.65]|eukprot:XP_012199599.1 hypothetical protein SPRG_05490 [Saprolegnia parasitica CBS 223.65]